MLSCFGWCGVFRLSDAVRCDFLGLGVFGFLALGWFLFLAFCRVLPVCTVANMGVFKFWGWLVYSSARFFCVAYFYIFKGSWMVWAFCLGFLGCFVVVFYYFLYFPPFLSFCQLFLIFVVFSLDFF